MKKRAKIKRHLYPPEFEDVRLPRGSYKWTDEQWAEWEKQRADDHARSAGVLVEPNDGSGGRRKMPVRYE
jgi:hypothetical protein